MIPGEWLVVVLIMNVQPDDIGGDFLQAERVRNPAHLRLGIIAVTTLIKAERPPRRQWHSPGQGGVTFDDFFRIGPVDEIIIQIAAFRAKRQQVLPFAAHVKRAAPGVIQKNPMGLAAADDQVEWHGNINRVRARIVGESVCVPHDIIGAAQFPTALVELAIFFAEAINMLVITQLFGDAERRAGKRDSAPRIVGVQNFTGGIRKRNSQWRLLHDHFNRSRCQRGGIGTDLNFCRHRAQIVIDDGVRMIAAKGFCGGKTNADDIVRQRCEAE